MKKAVEYMRRADEKQGWIIIYKLSKNKSKAVAVNYYADCGDESCDSDWMWVDNIYKEIAKEFGAVEAVIVVNNLRYK